MGVTYVSSLVCGLGVFGVLKVVPWGGVRSARAMFFGCVRYRFGHGLFRGSVAFVGVGHSGSLFVCSFMW